MSRWKFHKLLQLAPLIALVLLAVVFFVGLGRDPTMVPSTLIGKPPPSFTLEWYKMNRQFTEKDLHTGEVTIVNFFASWCLSCRDEMPYLNELHKMGTRIIGINYKDKENDMQKFLAEYGNPYSAIIIDRKGTTAIDFGVYGIPETFIIDSKGIIAKKIIGPVDLGKLLNTATSSDINRQ